MWAAAWAASISACVPRSPTNVAFDPTEKLASHFAMTGPVSFLMSVVTKTTELVAATEAGTCRSAVAMSARVAGQTSGHCVYPKNRNVGWPDVFDPNANGLPAVSVSVNDGRGCAGTSPAPWYLPTFPAPCSSEAFGAEGLLLEQPARRRAASSRVTAPIAARTRFTRVLLTG